MSFVKSRLFAGWPSLIAVLGVLALVAPAAGLAQEEEREPLNRREVSRAIDIAEDHMEEAEDAERDGDMEAAQAAWSQAGGFYLRVLQDYPDRHDVRIALARIYVKFEEWENVAASYSLAVEGLEDDGEILEAWTEMTNAYSMMENDLKVIEAGQKVLDLNPNPSADVYLGVGAAMARQGQFEGASEMAEAALALDPDSAVAHQTLGQAAFAAQDFDAAEASFRRAVELDATTARAHAGLAEIYFARGDFQAAVDSATAALDLNDQLTAAYGIRGKANNALGNQQQAHGDLAMAITVNANDPAANLAFAQVYESQQNTGQATNYYQKVTELENSPPASRALAHAALGRFALAALNVDEGVRHMQAAAEADSSAEGVMSGLGQAWFEKAKAARRAQDLAGALEAATQAVAADGENPSYQVEQGIAMVLSQTDIAGALPILEGAIPMLSADADPGDAAVGHFALGQAYLSSNDFAGAEAQFSEATMKLDSWGTPFVMLAWAHTAQVAYGPCKLKDASFGERLTAAGVGCPASAADYERVEQAAAAYASATEKGAQDPTLAERIAVLQEVRNQIVE